MIRLPAPSRGGAEEQPGDAAAAVGNTGDNHHAAHLGRVEYPAFDRQLPCHHRGRMEGRVLGGGGVIPVDPIATDVEVGLAGAGERAGGRVHNCGVQACAGSVTGSGGADGRVGISQQARDRRPVVQVDHDRRGAAGLGDVRLGVVTDQRAITSWPFSCSSVSMRDPMNPAAPVSATFIAGAFSFGSFEAGPVPGSPQGR
jgi:hypothetical protein